MVSGAERKSSASRLSEDLKEIADRHNVAVVLVHHLIKSRCDDPLDATAGGFDFVANADTTLHMKRRRNRRQGELFVTGRDVDQHTYGLDWKAEDCRWELADMLDEVDTQPAQAIAFVQSLVPRLPLPYKQEMELAARERLTQHQVIHAKEKLGSITSLKQGAAWVWVPKASTGDTPSLSTLDQAPGLTQQDAAA